MAIDILPNEFCIVKHEFLGVVRPVLHLLDFLLIVHLLVVELLEDVYLVQNLL